MQFYFKNVGIEYCNNMQCLDKSHLSVNLNLTSIICLFIRRIRVYLLRF